MDTKLVGIVLVGLEIWTDVNRISVMDGSAGDVLGRFVSWRQKDLLKRSRNDVGHLIIKSLGTNIVAHELGHNLGMKHDDKRCPPSYIMHSTDKNFSTCSADDFEAFILHGGGNCLRNPPKTSNVYKEPVCGNNVVDNNEECDCGKPQNFLCCSTKSVVPLWCKQDVCDLPEYCNGSTAYCPDDVYIMNGYPCSHGKAYCYYGLCQSFDSQCESIYGKGARKAPDICFEKANIKGDRFGNCGMKGGVYKKCPVQHSLCGKLQCTSVSLQNLPAWSVVNNASGVLCWSSDFDLGSDIPDPAQVHDGTACGENKACVGFECVDARYLGYNCDVKEKCNNNGVCNNNGNCHCNPGWAPPFCNHSGYGGSVDSGPAHTGRTLKLALILYITSGWAADFLLPRGEKTLQEKQRTAQVFPFLQGLFQHESVLQLRTARQVDALSTQTIPHLLKYQTLPSHPLLPWKCNPDTPVVCSQAFFSQIHCISLIFVDNCIVWTQEQSRLELLVKSRTGWTQSRSRALSSICPWKMLHP
uniref:Uncharacterized protein n=1 Tax=Cyanoderma ruficeps TaxID=181631 RepID=A0A8C3RF82_9PASS